jgi:hypothetical protein
MTTVLPLLTTASVMPSDDNNSHDIFLNLQGFFPDQKSTTETSKKRVSLSFVCGEFIYQQI